ncbi:glycosyltransferase family 4 protein [Yeosuana sp.]|uniref:glycosyltransferase family 4 protein n=1 Tax=Yeosuana sp. TaxID=2529388 RepID=UPI004054E3DB
MPKKNKMFLISNMYPSKKHIRYGIFVKNFEKAIEHKYYIKRIVLVKHKNVLLKLLSYTFLYLNILKLIFVAKKQDVIYVHFPLHVAPAICCVFFFKKRIILNFHGSDLLFDNIFTKLLSKFLKPLIKRNYIVVPSNYYKSKIVKEYNILPNQVFVYPSGGINTTVFYPQQVQKKEGFILGFVSNFIKSKGWKVLLIAVEKIVKENSIDNLEVVLIGEGPDKQEINKFLDKGDIKHKVISSVSQKKLAVMYNGFDLFIFPTEAESLGLVGLEAMACGIPVIAAKVEGPMEYIDQGVNSYLFEKKNSADLVDKILHYYSLSKKEKERIKTNAIKTAKLYESTKVNKKLLSFLKDLKTYNG